MYVSVEQHVKDNVFSLDKELEMKIFLKHTTYLHFGFPSSMTQIPPFRHFNVHNCGVGVKLISQRVPVQPLGQLEKRR